MLTRLCLDPGAIKLVKRLSGLPLALATAGTYLGQTTESVSEYLDGYGAHWHDLSENTEELLEYEDRTLFSTWNLSLDRVRARDADTAKLMGLLAYFGPQDIRYELFQPAADYGLPWLSALTETKRRFNRALALLHEYSLIEVSATGYSLHNCVHDWALQALNRDINVELFRVALHCIASNVQIASQKDYWQNNRLLMEHAVRVEHHHFSGLLNAEILDYSCLPDLHKLGGLWATQEDYFRAEPFFVRAFAGMKTKLGKNHISPLEIAADLGKVYCDQGRFSASEQMYQLVLEEEEALGPNHLLFLDICNSLGVLYFKQKRPVEAQQQFERTLNGLEKVLGLHDVTTLDTVYNIGVMYHRQGEAEHAEKMYERALAGCKEVLGSDHPRTLGVYYNLGRIYYTKEKLSDAETMLYRALVGHTRVLGPEHELTLYSAFCLGGVYAKQEKVLEAERVWQHAVERYKKISTPLIYLFFPRSVYNLGRLYYDQNRLEEAEQMYQQALEWLLNGCGTGDGGQQAIKIRAARDLAALYQEQGRIHEAEELKSRYNWSDLLEFEWPLFSLGG